jgi:3-isopropylmalate/(R)-2-methylmalate dehydratase small subunit
VTTISGRAIALRGVDIDTDRIIPARFLRSITFEGLERHVFADDRAHVAALGRPHAFDEPAAADARILLTHANFGCGSSREHAPQALRRWGIHAIVGESFGEIFAGNSLAIGLACVTASRETIDELMALVERAPSTIVEVDLDRLAVAAGSIVRPIMMPASARAALLSGEWNATNLLLRNYDEVERVEAQLPYLQRTTSNEQLTTNDG